MLLDDVVQLGFYFRFLARHVDDKSAATGGAQTRRSPRHAGARAASSRAYLRAHTVSMYARALAAGVDEVLDEYRDCVAQLEQEVVAEPTLPLSHLRFRLSEVGGRGPTLASHSPVHSPTPPPPRPLQYFLVLPSVCSLLRTIDAKQLHSGAMLDLVHHRAETGTPSLQRVFRMCVLRTAGARAADAASPPRARPAAASCATATRCC